MTYVQPIWMADHSCLNCDDGVYPGYQGLRTLPCPKCGDTRPAAMKPKAFHAAVRRRDRRFGRGAE